MLEFSVNDHAVYPGHGVGRVTAIEKKEIMGSEHVFYVITILDTEMKLPVKHKYQWKK